MDSKQKGRRILGCFFALFIFMVSLVWLGGLLHYGDNAPESERSYNSVRLAPFYKDKEKYDVLLLGTSHMIYGVDPMKLWKEEGITAFDIACHAAALPTQYWELVNALDYTEPKLLVLDCAYISGEIKYNSMSRLHMAFDPIPLSFNKIRAVMDLADEGDNSIDKNFLTELLFPFTLYHSRWNELGKTAFDPIVGKCKGGGILVGIWQAEPHTYTDRTSQEKLAEKTLAMEYLERIIQLCQGRNIDVLLTYLPLSATEAEKKEANTVYDIAQEYHVNYIDFLDINIIDPSIDLFDRDHLNPSGADKVTHYLEQYIKDNYDIPDRRSDPDYEKWDQDYLEYRAFRMDVLRQQTELKTYLMLLRDEGLDVLFQIQDPSFMQNDTCMTLFRNLGADTAGLEWERCLLIDRPGGEFATVWADEEAENVHMTALGKTRLQAGALYVEDKKYLPPLGENEKGGMRIVVLKHETGELVDVLRFAPIDSPDGTSEAVR